MPILESEVPMIRGVLFDMDGVLADSEAFICEAAMAMFAEHGLIVRADDFLPFVGAGENRYLGGVAALYGFPLDVERDKARTYALYGEFIKGRLEELPGARRFLAACRDRGLKAALATSADRVKMDHTLREIGLPPGAFDTLVNGLDVERRKPWPDIYREAARRLGLNAADCLVVEDAPNGVRAGKAAGSRCLGLTSSFTGQELREAGADWIAGDLAGAPAACLAW